MKLNSFPVENGDIHRKILVVDTNDNIFTGRFYSKETHDEDCCALEWHNDGFEGSSFYPTKYLKGWMEFPKINKIPEKMDIELIVANPLSKKLEYLMNIYGFDTKLNTPDYILASYILSTLNNLQMFTQERDHIKSGN